VNFDRTEEQHQLAASIARFAERDYDFATRRGIVASAEGWSGTAWRTMADLGLLGLPLPAEFGGFGGGAVDTMVAMEAIGAALVVEPYLSTVGLGAQLVARGGTAEQKARLLPGVIAGDQTLAFAQLETDARYDAARVATRATRRGDGGCTIDGEKRIVVHGEAADLLLVSARIGGDIADAEGIGVFLVDPKMAGISRRGYRTLDGLRAADVAFDQVRVDADALVGGEGDGLALIEEVIDFATALICAEAVGVMGAANALTLDYLKTRRQFGAPIGSFQALQHRMVDLVIEHEQAKSMASLACTAVDTEKDAGARKRLVSAAKVRISDACRLVSQEAVQMHGGMGMSDEMKVSHAFRRLTVIAQQFGDAEHHLERYAAHSGVAADRGVGEGGER
jgi:alkylation response protein AidB-like acyl-CoA dehydrogenase